MDRLTPLPPVWLRWCRGALCAVAVVCAVGVTGAIHRDHPTPLLSIAAAKPPAREPPELLHDIPTAPEPAPAISQPVVPSVPPSTGPVLRGVYVGAAKTALESNGKAHVVWLEVTGYCPCEKCCGPNAVGVTASGKPVSYHAGVFAAADPTVLPFGTRVSVPGYHDGAVAEVVDRGSAIVGNRLDVFFPTHAQAEEWGRQWLPVRVEDAAP